MILAHLEYFERCLESSEDVFELNKAKIIRIRKSIIEHEEFNRHHYSGRVAKILFNARKDLVELEMNEEKLKQTKLDLTVEYYALANSMNVN